MLGCIQPMSSPMMNRMLGFSARLCGARDDCCALVLLTAIKIRIASAAANDRKLLRKCMFITPWVLSDLCHVCAYLASPACAAGVSADRAQRKPTWLLPLVISPFPRLPTR